jgi:uncharacterized protein DUF5947
VSGDSSAFAVLARIRGSSRPPVAGERCEMCAEAIGDSHPHVVNLASRSLLCTCRGCWLLFTAEQAELRYRAVPERYLAFTGLRLDATRWAAMDIPVGLAFLFRNSVQERWVAFYPGPAGAAESELPLAAWDGVLAANPALSRAVPDVEALLLRAPAAGRESVECYLVPIDACYQLVGELRQVWRGFDGGQQARAAIEDFFATVAARARPVEAGA